jgi:hypothetical protein
VRTRIFEGAGLQPRRIGSEADGFSCEVSIGCCPFDREL